MQKRCANIIGTPFFAFFCRKISNPIANKSLVKYLAFKRKMDEDAKKRWRVI